MDFNSGRFPLDFFSFYLDMSSENVLEEATTIPTGTEGPELSANPLPTVVSSTQVIPQETLTPSPSTEESVSAYVERTLQELGPQHEVRFNPTIEAESTEPTPEQTIPKASVLDAIDKLIEGNEGQPDGLVETETHEEEMSEEGQFKLKADYFQTDTSSVEELYDSAGADTTTRKLTFIASGVADPEEEGQEDLNTGRLAETSSVFTRVRQSKEKTGLTVPGRALLKKYFNEAPPVHLPVGHRTLALSEPQVHALLKVVSDEAVSSSLHTMHSLVNEALKAGSRMNREWAVPGGSRAPRTNSESSAEDTSRGGHTTDDYTSGALSSDDDFITRRPTLPQVSTDNQATSTDVVTSSEMIPSPGFTASDYRPLSQLCAPQSPEGPKRPVRKRRKVAGSTGKVMKEAYFKGIKWTKTFVTGPLDPEHNKHKFYCQICKANISMFSKGAREIVRHYQSESHLRKDQRWRYEHLRLVDPVTGQVRHEVRGKDGRVLTPVELEREKPLFENAVLVDIGDKHPFYDDYIAGTTATPSSEEIRICTQISLVGHFVPQCGDVLLLQTLWNQIGIAANHKEPFSPLEWGATTLTVSILSFLTSSSS